MKSTLFLILALLPALALAQPFSRNYDIPVVWDGETLADPWAGGLNSCQFSAIDLNGDPLLDLFVFDRVGDRISTFLAEMSGDGVVYRYTREFQEAFPAGLRNWAFVRDFNCDGKGDLVSNHQSGMKIWFNTSENGELSFEPAQGGTIIQASYDFGQSAFDAPIYTISPDLPSFVDYDGDGDTDVFSFTETSVGMYFFLNRQQELGDCGNLHFVCANRCYGMFNESPESFDIFKGDAFQCDFNVANPRSGEGPQRHVGGTILQLDLDQNGIPDLVLGDVTEPNLIALEMEDAQDGQDSATVAFDNFPSPYGGGEAVDLHLFPGAFYLDVDQDGVRDLLVSPNSSVEAADRRSVWWYRNAGQDDLPALEKIQDDFLQEGMIDLGLGAYPVAEDIDQDGRMDLLAANREYYSDSEPLTSRIWYFRNTGTLQEPAFELLDSNWMDIPGLGWEAAYPAFGDLDGDGDRDLVVGRSDGLLSWFENLAGAGAPMLFGPPQALLAGASPVDVGQFATPQILDLDEDGLLDLAIGEKGGNINFYRNSGTTGSALFELSEDSIGDVVATSFLGILGYSVPHFFRNGEGEWELLLGTETGQINHYTGIAGNLGGTFTLATQDFAGIHEGIRSAVFMSDYTGDGAPDLWVGQFGGGLGLYINENLPPAVGELDPAPWRVAPNPSAGVVRILSSSTAQYPADLRVYDSLGRIVLERSRLTGSASFDVSDWNAGIYLLRIGTPKQHVALRLVVAH